MVHPFEIANKKRQVNQSITKKWKKKKYIHRLGSNKQEHSVDQLVYYLILNQELMFICLWTAFF